MEIFFDRRIQKSKKSIKKTKHNMLKDLINIVFDYEFLMPEWFRQWEMLNSPDSYCDRARRIHAYYEAFDD